MTFEDIARLSQSTLKKRLVSELSRMGYRPRSKKGFLYAKGRIPVMLVAHLDTVHKVTPQTICRSQNGCIVMSPEGIGGDDRAGVYMILQIIKQYHCHALFCEDEEQGGIGASEFTKSGFHPSLHYIVELDRRGSNDAVFYDCDNPVFTKYVTGFGFEEAEGSFSDISVIAPKLGAAAVNISTGYFYEHTLHEYVDMRVVAKNIERVGRMIAAADKPFEYIESVRSYNDFMGNGLYDYGFGIERFYRTNGRTSIRRLMCLPDTVYIKTSSGELAEIDGQYMIDDKGRVYEYLFDYDVAVETKDVLLVADSESHLRYKEEMAMVIEVVPMEVVTHAYELSRE